MGRRINKVKTQGKQTEWIFKINVELNRAKPRIAFLSGLERSYYPEDPGYSKFALEYQQNLDETPECAYNPSAKPKLQKPVSTKGYSIGGLNGPRLAKLHHAANPSPDKYQSELNDPLLKSHRKTLTDKDDFRKYSLTDPLKVKQKQVLAHQRSQQCYVGFGSLISTPRFGRPPTFNTAGVGIYNILSKGPPRLKINASFGSSPVIRKQSAEIRCIYDEVVKCIECRKSLDIPDHYRTRFIVRVPLPETYNLTPADTDFPRGSTFVNLCNICYYRAIQGHSKNWPKNKVRWMFQKVRTCASIHEHQGLPELVHKTDCKTTRRLQLKEAILSKHYPDRVEESLPATMF